MKLTPSNYYDQETNKKYMSASQYKDFAGSLGSMGCEARALARIKGEYIEEPSKAMLIGSFVDAYFEGTIDDFKNNNPEIYTKKGELRAEYLQAEVLIKRIERDAYFMKTLSGEKQVIMEAKIFGANWKIKIDSYFEGKTIVDLKTCASIQKAFWVKDLGYIDFGKYWGYDIQLAIYQKVVEINTGEKLPCLISAISKEKEPDIECLIFTQQELDEALGTVEQNIGRILTLKEGQFEPSKCGVCDYCKSKKVIEKPILFSDLVFSIN